MDKIENLRKFQESFQALLKKHGFEKIVGIIHETNEQFRYFTFGIADNKKHQDVLLMGWGTERECSCDDCNKERERNKND